MHAESGEGGSSGFELGADGRALLRLWSRATRPHNDGNFIGEALAAVRDRLAYEHAYVVGSERDDIVASSAGAPPPPPAALLLARDAQTRRSPADAEFDGQHAFAVPAQDGRHVLVLLAERDCGASRGDAPAFARVIADAIGARLGADDGSAFLAYHDPLTLLPNRTAFAERLEEVLAASERDGSQTALLYVDLDGFKAVNDGHGHATGDIVLAEVAHRLRDVLRRSEFVARLGGDEFAVIVHPLAEVESADDIARRILHAIARPIGVENVTFAISASIGVAVAPDDARTIDGLLRRGDEAMYRAKEAGGGRVHIFGRDVQARVERRRRILSDLDGDALEREFLLCYQPIVDAKSGALIGAEALPRWRHPLYGLLTASTIFASLGASRLVALIDAWVMAEARAEASRLRDQGLPLTIHVNVASLDTAALAGLEGDGGPVALEFAESAAVRDLEATLRFCDAARELGFETGIDRFGSSPVRLRELGRLRLDFVKLDPALLGTPALAATVAFARSFGWSTCISGVRNAQQLREIGDAGIDCAQGYHLGAPMTVADLIGWARELVT